MAVDQLIATRSLPLSLNQISDAIGASRALVYAYFSNQDAIVEAVLATYLRELDDAGLQRACKSGSVVDRGQASAAICLRQIAERGAVLHIIFRDAPHGVILSREVTGPRNAALRALTVAARRELSPSDIPNEGSDLCEPASTG